jgi:protein-disulfide isomerase
MRAFAVLVAAFAAALLASPVRAQEVAGDHALGNPKATVTVIEYGSVACPICGRFNETVMPELKTKYIDTGKVRYIFRPMLTGVQTIAMSGERLAECAGKDRYFEVVDAMMRGQKEYYAYGESDVFARPVLLRIAKSFGFDEAAFDKCVMDPAGLKAVNANNTKYLASGIDSTPTIVVNGKQLLDPDFKALSAAIDAAAH